MVKNLLIMRHAKSDWSDASLDDKRRPLNKRGLQDAPKMGKFLKGNKLLPQLILCSPAKRARMTADAIQESSKGGIEVLILDHLYPGSLDALHKELLSLPANYDKVMVVSHNPFVEECVSYFLSSAISSGISMPTATIVGITFRIDDWADMKKAPSELSLMITPKMLKSKK